MHIQLFDENQKISFLRQSGRFCLKMGIWPETVVIHSRSSNIIRVLAKEKILRLLFVTYKVGLFY